jgi:hypothetical protein
VKLNGGILCLVLFALAVWRLAPWGWRSELVLALSFAVSLVVLGLVTGNAPGALVDWLRVSRHVVGSYTDAMALDPTGRTPETVIAILLALGGAAAVYLRGRDVPRTRAIALALVAATIWAATAFAAGDSSSSTSSDSATTSTPAAETVQDDGDDNAATEDDCPEHGGNSDESTSSDT